MRPTSHHATTIHPVWSWDCTWLPGPVKGTFYYLVMIIDIFSRKVVGWEVFLQESAANAQCVLERAVLAERVCQQPLVLHADNGSPFKAATLLEKLRDMNIEASSSRPRVSNDNPRPCSAPASTRQAIPRAASPHSPPHKNGCSSSFTPTTIINATAAFASSHPPSDMPAKTRPSSRNDTP
jgi:hypothetical protein